MLFYNLALIDAIFLPISVAVIASRNCELEHKGATLKLLETMVTPGRLYCTKMLWGALVLATLLAVRSAAFAAMGAAVHFSGDIPWGEVRSLHCHFLGSQHDGLRSAAGAVPALCQPGGFPCVRHLRQFHRNHVHAFSRIGWCGLSPGGTMACCRWPGWSGIRTPGSLNISGAGRNLWMWHCFCCGRRCFFIVGRTLFVRKEV